MGTLTKQSLQVVTKQLDDSLTEDTFEIIYEDGKEINRKSVDFQTVFGHETDRIKARSKPFQRIAAGHFVPTLKDKHAANEAYSTAKQARAEAKSLQDAALKTKEEAFAKRALAKTAHDEAVASKNEDDITAALALKDEAIAAHTTANKTHDKAVLAATAATEAEATAKTVRDTARVDHQTFIDSEG